LPGGGVGRSARDAGSPRRANAPRRHRDRYRRRPRAVRRAGTGTRRAAAPVRHAAAVRHPPRARRAPRPLAPRGPGDPPPQCRRAAEATLDDIANGRLAKLVLARACSVRTTGAFDPLRVLARLRRANPGCTIFGVAQGAAMFVGASPERLARVTGRRLDTAAVAGTAPSGMTAHALASNPKERAEHAFVVDDIVRELGALTDQVVSARAPP